MHEIVPNHAPHSYLTSSTSQPGRTIIFSRALTFCLALLPACRTVPDVEQRLLEADQLAKKGSWVAVTLHSQPHMLRAYVPQYPAVDIDTLSIYIEGDGHAWRSRRTISNNPTPVNPVALQLALTDPGPAAYLARPCQYILASGCDPAMWSSARFSEAVIQSSNDAIEQLKQRLGARQLRLIGFSGGGAVAALVAARRNDVTQLITIAGNLDHVTWTGHHHVTPLTDSLNPADSWQQLIEIPQVHFVGEDDRIVSKFVAEAYRQRFPSNRQPDIKVVGNADHNCCWVEKWPVLMREYSQPEPGKP